MSTYTDLHLRTKENITVLRMPGNPYDGMTPQRVIFQNPENVYNGTFIGKLNAICASFDNVQLNDSTVVGGVLSNVALMFGNDEELDLSTLTSNISEMSENIDSLQEFQTSVEISCQNISSNLRKLGLSVEQISSDVSDLSNSLNVAINHIDELSDSISTAISSNDDLSCALSSLSIDFNNYVLSNNESISSINSNILRLSDEFIDYADLNDKSISEISNSLSGLSDEFVLYKEDTDDKIDSLQKQIQGGLIYQQSLLIDNNIYDYTLSHLFIENGIESNSSLSIGYFYVAQTLPEHRISSYIYDGVKLEHGDWLLIKQNCYVSSMTSDDVDVLDAQDFDSFKLNDDNVVAGNNKFNGNTTFNGTISSYNTAVFLNGLTSNSLSSQSLSVDSFAVKSLNIELSNVNYGISSLQDLSNDIYNRIDGVQSTAVSAISESNKAIDASNSAIISVLQFSNELSNKADISSIPTDLSAFTNSPGFLISNDLSDYCYTRNETSSAIEISAGLSNKVDISSLSDYALSIDVQNQLLTKQDKLSEAQISAIDSIVDERATIVKYADGAVSSFNIVGEIIGTTIPNHVLITEVKIGTAVIGIGYTAFDTCHQLTSVSIPDSVTYIAGYAFYDCINLSSAIIPDSVTNIEQDAFNNCINLTSIIVKGKTQAQAETLFANTGVPLSIITTWNDASQEWVTDQGYISSIPDDYKTYDAIVSSLSNDGYSLSIDVDTLVSSISTDISIDYVNKINGLSIENYAQLSDISKVFIKNPDSSELSDGMKSDLSIIKLTNEEYAQILSAGSAQPNTMYVISSCYKDAYGQQLKNLAEPQLSSDAATKNYVDDSILSANIEIKNTIINALSTAGIANDTQLSNITLGSVISAMYNLCQLMSQIN